MQGQKQIGQDKVLELVIIDENDLFLHIRHIRHGIEVEL